MRALRVPARYAPLERREEADGHRASRTAVEPLAVQPVGDLLGRHADAGIKLRVTPSFWLLHDAVAPRTGASRSSDANASPR